MIPIKVNNDSLSFMIMIIKNILLAHIIIKVPQQCYIKGALILKMAIIKVIEICITAVHTSCFFTVLFLFLIKNSNEIFIKSNRV